MAENDADYETALLEAQKLGYGLLRRRDDRQAVRPSRIKEDALDLVEPARES